MRSIEPKKGISKRLIVNGLSEKNYIIAFSSYIVSFFIAAYLIRLFMDKKISFNLFFFLVFILAGSIFFLRYLLQKQTQRENTKKYPKEKVRIINKDFR